MLERIEGALLGDQKEFGKAMKAKPVSTSFKVLLIVLVSAGCSFGVVLAYSWGLHAYGPPESKHYTATRTIYSNVIPMDSDIIDLDSAGTLTPSPYNVLQYGVSDTGACVVNGKTVPYTSGVVMMLNVPTVLALHDPADPSKPVRYLAFEASTTPASSYYTFLLGKTQVITTKKRTFDVTLAHIEDETSVKNGPYFAYTFDISEE